MPASREFPSTSAPEADATPVKETPPPAPTNTTDQGSVVFGELDGTETPAADEQLVSRDDSAETSVADVATPVGDDTATGTGDTAASESELANRKVRTVTVRPDGTIVSGDEAVAGNETLPVDRPVVPDLPGADVQPSELLAALPTNDAAAPATAQDPIAAITEAPATDPVAELPADAKAATCRKSRFKARRITLRLFSCSVYVNTSLRAHCGWSGP